MISQPKGKKRSVRKMSRPCDSIYKGNLWRCFTKKRQHLPFSLKLAIIQDVKPGKCLQNTYLTPT